MVIRMIFVQVVHYIFDYRSKYWCIWFDPDYVQKEVLH